MKLLDVFVVLWLSMQPVFILNVLKEQNTKACIALGAKLGTALSFHSGGNWGRSGKVTFQIIDQSGLGPQSFLSSVSWVKASECAFVLTHIVTACVWAVSFLPLSLKSLRFPVSSLAKQRTLSALSCVKPQSLICHDLYWALSCSYHSSLWTRLVFQLD